jgi:DNA-binding transcriptional LysR family regulator
MFMEDHRLKAFCLVVEHKSFSKAAEAKFMTQSAMSHLIKNLEDELGVKLLRRDSKSIALTPAGRVFYEHSKRILDQYKEMENGIYALTKKVKGPLHIGATPTAADYLLPQVFYDFSRKYPDVRIELAVSNTEKKISDVLKGEIDMGIVEGNIKNREIFLDEIAEDEIVIIASEDNDLAKKKSVSVSDLLTQSFIMPETGSGIREFIEDFFHSSKVNPENIKTSMTIGSVELIMQMVQSGMGISFVSKWSAFGPVKEGSLKILNIPGKKLKRKFYITSAEKEPSGITVRTFKNFLKEFNFFMPF